MLCLFALDVTGICLKFQVKYGNVPTAKGFFIANVGIPLNAKQSEQPG